MAEQKNPKTKSGHILKGFDARLEHLRLGLLQIGGLIEQQLQFCEELLSAVGDTHIAPMQLVRERENRINELELQISHGLVEVLTMHQTMAIDTRVCVSYMRISLDLERIGDELEHVAQALVELRGDAILSGKMGTAFAELLKACNRAVVRSLNALSVRDEKEARQVIERDKEINQQQEALQQQLVDALTQHAIGIEAAICLMQAARSLERTGDHAKNLSQAVVYVITGKDPRNREIEQKAGNGGAASSAP